MSTLIVMPDGNALSPVLIKQVSLHKNRVICRDAQQRIIAWINVADEGEGKRVRDILIRLATDGPRPVPPDWSFMKKNADAS